MKQPAMINCMIHVIDPMKNFKWILTVMVCSGSVFASQPGVVNVAPYAVSTFKKVFQINQTSAEMIAYGGSFIDKGEFVGVSQFEIRNQKPVLKAILMWMGEGRGSKNEDFFSLELETTSVKPVHKTRIIPSEKKTEDSDRYVYSCWADVTKHFLKSGHFKLKMNKVLGVTPPYQGAGWSLFLVYEDQKNVKRNIFINWGLHKLQPGEIYDFPIISPLRNQKISRVVVVGGHGQKENGSGNILNGETLSIGDDWNGSSGELWDVDEYDLSFFKKEAFTMDKGVTLTIDPLLQWLFPIGFVVQTEKIK